MADFNPDEYLADFNPDEYLGEGGATAQSQAAAGWKKLTPGILKAMDYTGGLTRTALAHTNPAFSLLDVINKARKGEQPKGLPGEEKLREVKQDFTKAIKGEAPSLIEQLQRRGVPDVVAKPAGFAGDVATDVPVLAGLARVSPSSKWAAKLGRFATAPLSATTKRAGEAVYDSAYKNIDKVLQYDKGRTPLTQILKEAGRPASTVTGLPDVLENIASKKLSERNAILQEMADKGIFVSSEPTRKAGEALVAKLKYVDNLADDSPEIERLMNEIEKYTGRTKQDPFLATDIKSRLQSKGKAALERRVSDPSASDFQQLYANLGSGQKGSIETAAGEIGKKDTLKGINDTLATLIESDEPVIREIKKAITKNMLSQIDAPLMIANPTLGAAKKLAEWSSFTGPRSYGGKGMILIGDSLMPDAAARQAIKYNPWTLREKE